MTDLNAVSQETTMAHEFAPFLRGATYYRDMDYVEYVTADQLSRSERIDEHLTLIWDKHDDLLGFRIKGFRHLFESRLRTAFRLAESDFVYLVSVLEAVVTALGDEMLGTDSPRARAYGRAWRLAANDDVRVYDLPMAA